MLRIKPTLSDFQKDTKIVVVEEVVVVDTFNAEESVQEMSKK